MKPTFKYYLSIALALLAIFLCGYGIGFLFGERKGMRSVPESPTQPPTQTSSIANWEETTLALIQKSIELTPEQLVLVKAEIAKSAARVRAAREDAFDAYRRESRALNERLQPHLTPEQRNSLPGASPK